MYIGWYWRKACLDIHVVTDSIERLYTIDTKHETSPVLVCCWATVVDGGPTSNQHWVHVPRSVGKDRSRWTPHGPPVAPPGGHHSPGHRVVFVPRPRYTSNNCQPPQRDFSQSLASLQYGRFDGQNRFISILNIL